MRHHLRKPAALTAGLAVVLAASAAVTTTAPAAATVARTATATSAVPAHPAGHAVFLVTGELVTPGGAGGRDTSVLASTPAAGSEDQLQVLTLGGRTYALPAEAAPYLGRGLDPSLFQTGALAKAESGGRLPVRVGYAAHVPVLPGVTITSSGSGTAEGYLTPAGARVFGTALARQFAADHADGGYGQNGLFAGGVTMTLAGAGAAARPGPAARPEFVMHTLTVRGTNLSGRPDTGDEVTLIDADNASRFWTPGEDSNTFYDGVAKFSVPAGHFWVIGYFYQLHGDRVVSTHVDLLPEITVTRNTKVHMAARAANSKIQFATSRPATIYSDIFETDYLTDRAPHGCCSESDSLISTPGQRPGATLYVSPMPTPARVGRLTQITTAQLDSPSAAPGVPYQYDVAYQSPAGTIQPQHFVVDQARLATERAGFYASKPSTGYLASYEAFPIQRRLGSTAVFPAVRFPERLTMYLTASASLTWSTQYIEWGRGLDFVGGQTGSPQVFLPGQRLTDNWGAYPLHPAASVKLLQGSGETPVTASATRAGDVLGLEMSAFGDNTPGHTGWGLYRPFPPAGSYEVDQNETKIAGGPLPRFHGFVGVSATLSPARSLIKFVLTAAQPATLSPLSTVSRTVWTWWSAHEGGTTLPPGWTCTTRFGRSCAAQPLLNVRYGVLGMGVDGSAAPGQQVVRLAVGHVQPANGAKITNVTLSVSFDGGKTWQPAQVTGTGGNYAAVFNAPAGAMVTLKTAAADAAGGSVTQTITNAYQTATAAGWAVRAACPAAGPRQARCFALYAPQVKVNAAIAAKAAGRRVPPRASTPVGWGAKDIESAYKLPVSEGAGQTVALVDAYSTPHLASDLAVYRKEYGLPPCTTASGCLRIVNQQGRPSPLPQADPAGWGVEETLDVSMVSAACPLCKIILVEAKQPELADLGVAEDTAARLSAQVISNSYGARESGFSQADAKFYEHPGHVVVASSGDLGFGAANFPANLAGVTSVGGTKLAKAAGARGWTESVWNNNFGASASGCSAYVAKPSWQHDPHCPGRTVADVSALASNVPVYDSSITKRQGGPWLTVYGTSAAAPIVAGVYALAGNAATVKPGNEYAHASALFDVTQGNNAFFGTARDVCGDDYLCVAKKGYDAPTGLGTPDGTGAF